MKCLLPILCGVFVCSCHAVKLAVHEATSSTIDYTQDASVWNDIDRKKVYRLKEDFVIVGNGLFLPSDPMLDEFKETPKKVAAGSQIRFESVILPAPQYRSRVEVRGTIFLAEKSYKGIRLNEVCVIETNQGQPILSINENRLL